MSCTFQSAFQRQLFIKNMMFSGTYNQRNVKMLLQMRSLYMGGGWEENIAMFHELWFIFNQCF